MEAALSGHPRKRILVVEGDEDFLVLMRLILADAHWEIVSASRGAAALQAIQLTPPDLVVLDMNLPDMNGWEVYMQMQAALDGRSVPVIILSGQASRVDRSFGLNVAQVHDYLLKPFLPSRLRRSVLTGLSRTSPLPPLPSD